MGSIAVIGAGNVGQAIAGHMSLLGHDVRLYSRWEKDYAAIAENQGITLTGEVEGHARVSRLTTDLREAVEGANVVVIAAPAFAHAYLSSELAHILEPDQLVLFQPAVLGSALELTRYFAEAGRAPSVIAEIATSLYTCRIQGPATVYIGAIKHSVVLASIPSAAAQTAVDHLAPYFGDHYTIGADTLAVGLTNCNPIYHVPPAVLNFKTVEDADRLPLHSLVTPRIAEVINDLDEERLALARALGIEVPSFWEFLRTAYGVEEGTYVERVVAGYGRQAFPEPDSLTHRYFTEDIPFGLLTWSSLGAQIGLEMPLTDAFLSISEVLCGRSWEAGGRTAAGLGLDGADTSTIRAAFASGAEAVAGAAQR